MGSNTLWSQLLSRLLAQVVSALSVAAANVNDYDQKEDNGVLWVNEQEEESLLHTTNSLQRSSISFHLLATPQLTPACCWSVERPYCLLTLLVTSRVTLLLSYELLDYSVFRAGLACRRLNDTPPPRPPPPSGASPLFKANELEVLSYRITMNGISWWHHHITLSVSSQWAESVAASKPTNHRYLYSPLKQPLARRMRCHLLLFDGLQCPTF